MSLPNLKEIIPVVSEEKRLAKLLEDKDTDEDEDQAMQIAYGLSSSKLKLVV